MHFLSQIVYKANIDILEFDCIFILIHFYILKYGF